MVAELSPLAERPDFNRSQPPTFRNKHVVDVKRLVLMAVKKVGWARFGSLLFRVMSVVRAGQDRGLRIDALPRRGSDRDGSCPIAH